MGTLIHAVGHGLVASDTIMLANLTGGAGLNENTVYYVLASGLTADDFAVALTDGGAALVYTTDIAAGSVVRTDTYEVVGDGVMDPPPALPVPDAPALTSLVVSGVMRLYIELQSVGDIATRLRASEAQVTHNYVGVDPAWDSAQVLTLPTGSNTMSLPAMGATKYAVRSRVQDVYGNFGDWSAAAELTTDAGADSRGIIDGAITETKIADNSISTRTLQAHAVTADILATTLLLASLIKTADSGRRIEIDVDGVRLYDTDESLLVRIPTNGDPVYIKGQVNADSLISQTAAEFRTAASLAGSATMTLQNGIAAPSTAPALVASVDYLGLTSTPSGVSTAAGIAYDSGAGTFWLACDPTVAPNYVAQEFNATTGALVRSISATGSTTTTTTTSGSTSHVSDSMAYHLGDFDAKVATPMVAPRDGNITKVSVYAAGVSGTANIRVCVWNTSGTLLRESATTSIASGGAAGAGNSDAHNISLSAPLAVTAGTTYLVGYRHLSTSDYTQYDRDDGSGKSYYVDQDASVSSAAGYTTKSSSSKPNVFFTYTYTVDTRLETAPNVGVATDGTYIYTLDTLGQVWKYDRTTLTHVAHSGVQTAITGTKAKAGLFYDATATELIVTTTTGTGAGVYPKFVRVTPSTLAVSSTVYSAAAGTTFSGTSDTFRGGARVADLLNASAATYWISTTSAVYAYTFSGTTATQTANRDFGLATTVGDGLTHDGSKFRGWDSASSTKVWKFSAWDWTTTSTTLWVAYAWYDSAGTTHETVMGPRSSLTIRRHERVQVTTPAIPTGGADDPNAVRIYALQGASDTGAGTFWNEAQDSGTSRYLIALAGSGTHDGAGTAFPAGTPATLQDAGAKWSLKGDGTVAFATTVTPGGKPAQIDVLNVGSGNWTKPTGLAFAIVEGWGAGGGGGGAAATAAGQVACGGGGGGGGYFRKVLTAADLSGASTFAWVVGAGGTAGSTAGGNGGTGNSTTFTVGATVYTAPGGGLGGGESAPAATPRTSGGAGGAPTNGDVNIIGGRGQHGGGFAGQYSGMGSGGGMGANGAQGGGAGQSGAGTVGSVPGGGGSGAVVPASVTPGRVGGVGGAGLMVITTFFGA